MEIKSIDDVLKLSDGDIEKLTFKELMEVVEFVKSKFLSSELEIERQIELYSKAITILMKAREKVTIIKKQKEEIDKKYEEFISKLEEL
ncbi:MAG: exodeoxyribonuclease VII [Fervidobacterium sp.]|jgi:CII-binding regulator of phage lambda lysogenization HflD